MLPVTFENFFEQGASTIESSMRGIQKTYDEVVWGVDSPPDYIENKDKSVRKNNGTILRTAQQQQEHLQKQGALKAKAKSNSYFRTPGKNILQNTHSRYQHSFGTPTTQADDSWGNESSVSDPHSILMDSSSSSSECGSRKRRTPTPSWKYASASKHSNNSNTRSLSNLRISFGKKKKKRVPKERLKSKLESGSRSIDEIFGYSTRQTMTKTKDTLDQDVGLDFVVLDIPVSKNGLKKRSLLIVQRIDSKGLFAKTDLGVGDAILSINGTSFANERISLYSRRTARGAASEKPNIFQARALLNGRGRSVTIEYQKFGETNSSIFSSSFATQEKQAQEQGENDDDLEPLLSLQLQSQPSTKKFPSSSHSRRAASTRVDFLGMLRTNESPNLKKGKSMVPKGFSDDGESSSDDEHDELYRQEMEEPPRICRMARLKPRSLNSASYDVDKENNLNNIAHQAPDSPILPYASRLNNGPEEQIELLKQRVNGIEGRNSPSSPTPGSLQQFTKPAAQSPARSAFSDSKLPDGSPARSVRSESYLQDLRKTLSPTANAILADLSVGMADFGESTLTQSHASAKTNAKTLGQLIPPTTLAEGNHRDLIRVNRNVFEKLQQRVEFLKNNNIELRNEVTALKRNGDTNCQKLVQAETQLEQKEAKEKKYESQLDLLKSRLEISTIQSDKRHRELLQSKEKSIADNDKVISNLSKRIEGLEKANSKLIEQLKKVGAKRQEKQNSLQAQLDRLKMKFSAQSTLLDNVMTSNEELTSQNEAMESELRAYSVAAAAKVNAENNNTNGNKPPLHDGALAFATTGILFAEGSESELENIRRDPILLAQAQELSSCKERNVQLEDQVETLCKQLTAMSAQLKSKSLSSTIKSRRSSNRDTSEITPSLLDVTLTSSDDDAVDGMSTRTDGSTGREEPDNDPNVSVENPSDEEVVHPTNTFRLEYQHTFDNRDDLDENIQDDETISASNHSRNRHSQTIVDDSFDSVSSLVLMERILELETALQKTNLEPEESERFLVALQARISKLTARGYEKVVDIDIGESKEP